MGLSKYYTIAISICCFTLLFVTFYPPNSFASTSQSPLQTQCLSFPDVSINGNTNDGNDNAQDREDLKGLKIEVHLSDRNVENVGPLRVFIISSNGECAIAKINQDPSKSIGDEKQLTFEFDSGIIDVDESFNACVEISNNFNFVCVLGSNSPSKIPEKVFLEVPITNQNSIGN